VTRSTPRAATFVAPRAVELRELPQVALAPGMVRVATELSAISGGSELLFYRGQLEPDIAVDATLPWAGTLSYPLAYGYACAGHIRELGDELSADWLGARVFAFAPHQEEVCARADSLVRLPDSLPLSRAVFLPNMETAVSLAMDGAPLFGESVAVLGQGVVGQLLAALLARSGAERVVLIDRLPDRLERSRALCGSETDRCEWVDSVGPALHDRFDLVYELTGNPAALDDALSLARYEGRIVIGSWYGTKQSPLALGTRAHRNRNQLLFSQVSRIDSRHAARFDKARRLDVALRWLARVPLEALISHRVPFEQIAHAYRLLDQQTEPSLQVLITYVPASG